MKEYTAKEFEEMKKLKRDFEEVDQGQEFTIGTIQRRLLCGEKRATALYNDLSCGGELGIEDSKGYSEPLNDLKNA